MTIQARQVDGQTINQTVKGAKSGWPVLPGVTTEV
jgi:hypothetical protein